MNAAIIFALPAAIEDVGKDVLFVAGVIAALVGLYATLRAQFPPAARVMAWPFKVVWSILRAIASVPRWVWRQLWRDDDGVSRGPITRLLERRAKWMRTVITDVVGPMIEDARVASREQHDEQNVKIAEQNEVITAGFAEVAERLDRGSEIMSSHGDAIASLQSTLAKSVRPSSERTRSTDPGAPT